MPQLSFDFSDGVRPKTRRNIESAARAKAKELLGQESIFEVTTGIQEALDDVVASAARADGLPALDEERARKAAEDEKKARKVQEEEKQRQKDVQDEESRHLAEMLEREQARLSKLSARPITAPRDSQNPQNGLGTISFDRDFRHNTQDGSVAVVRSVRQLSLFRIGPVTKVHLACNAESGEECLPCFALKVAAVRSSSDVTKRQVQALETIFDNLLQLPSHPALLQPLGFRVQRASPAEGQTAGWEIHALSTFMPKGSLGDLLESTGSLHVETARTWIIQILEGLDHLHRNRIAHGRLSPNNVLLERSMEGGTVLKLTDFSFQQELHSIQGASTKFSTAPSAFWACPESANDEESRASSPRDIWDLGVLVLQMFFGLDVQRKFNAPNSLVNSSPLSMSFETFVTRMLAASSQKRPTAFDLLPDEFLRSEDPVLDDAPESSVLSPVSSLRSPGKPPRTRRESANLKMGPSRYASDFVELGRLGKGGFGEVVKARNKLDSTVYAIKKISQASPAALSSVLSEVMVLSRLNSPYVVRYITAWLQEDGNQMKDGEIESSQDGGTDDMLSFMPHSATGGLDFISSGGYQGIEFGYSSDEEAGSEAVSDSDASTDDATDESQAGASKAVEALTIQHRPRRRSSANRVVSVQLYIQMEFCQQVCSGFFLVKAFADLLQTLRNLIAADMSKNPDEVWRLLLQILQGLAHIHERGLIHRDIKPENIFLDQSNTAKIGDFGLAIPGQTSAQPSRKGFVAPELTASVGTGMYISPEVRSAKGGESYNDKADMYSLGIVLFEMTYHMSSAMERARTLEALRVDPPKFPTAFESPEKKLEKEIITSLLQHQVSKRPSSSDLLRSGKIPMPVEDEALQAAIRGSQDRTSPIFAKLLSSLFSPVSDERTTVRDYTYDLDINLRTRRNDLVVQAHVKDQLLVVFRNHGAVESARPQVIPALHSGPEAAKFVDSAGYLVQLPHDLRYPFARMLARLPDLASCQKSFSFGSVFRNNDSGGHPLMHCSVDFDIISNDSLDLALREAETIKVLDQILDRIPSLQSARTYLQISHSELLDRILEFVAAEKHHWEAIKQALSRLYTSTPQWTWTKLRTELRSAGVGSTTIDDLVQFDFRMPFTEAFSKLRGILTESPDLEATYRHLQALETYLRRFRIARQIFIYPLASLNEGLYRGGMLFQALLDSPKRKTVLCGGGRYDRLISEQHRGTKRAGVHAIGFSLAYEILTESMIRWHQKPPGKKLPKKGEEHNDVPERIRRCDVLVDSVD